MVTSMAQSSRLSSLLDRGPTPRGPVRIIGIGDARLMCTILVTAALLPAARTWVRPSALECNIEAPMGIAWCLLISSAGLWVNRLLGPLLAAISVAA